MTERNRSKGSKTFVWGVMGFLVLGMGGFGLSGAFLNTGASAVASVGDEEVTVDRFYQAFQQDIAQASQDFGVPLTMAQAQSFGIDQVTLRRLLTIAAIDNEAGNLNVSVGDAAVRDELVKNPAFQGLGGGFDPVAYDFTLERIQLTRDEYDAIVRNALTQDLIRVGVSGLGSKNETAASTVMSYIGEQRDYDWVRIDGNNLPEPAEEPNEAELQAYYEANPEAFTKPQTRDLTYVALTPEMLAAEVTVAEEDILIEFEARDALYNTEASVNIDRIAFGSMADAQSASDTINAEETSFDLIAADRGLNPEDIALGSVTANRVSVEAREILFAATEPGIYGPVSSSVGPALFRVNALRAAKSTPLEEVRDDIRQAIALNAAGNLVVNAFDDIDDLLAGGASLEELAAETDMQLFTINFAVENVEGLTAQEVFITEALAADVNEERDVLEAAGGSIFALRVDAINEEFVQPLADTRETAITGRKAERTQELILAHAETLKGLIESGADFSATMSANGLDAITVIAAARSTPSADTPPTVSQGVFELEAGMLAIYDDVSGAYLAKLTNVSAYDPDSEVTALMLTQIEGQISASIEEDIFNYYSNAVIGEAGFTVNQPLISAIITQNSGQ